MLKFLIIVLFSFISTFGFAYVYYKFVDAQKISFLSAFIFLLGVISSVISKYYVVPVLNYLSFFLFFPLLFYCIKPCSFRKILFYVLIIWLYGMAIDLLAMILFSFLHFLIGFDIFKRWFMAEHILTFVVFIFLMFIGHSKVIKNLTNSLYKKLVSIKYSDLSLIIFTIFTLIIAVIIVSNLKNLNFNLILLLILLMLLIIFALLIKVKLNEEENEKYLKTLKENNDFYIQVEDENRVFKHNLTAKLLSIKSVANKKSVLLIEDLLVQFNKNVDFSNHMKTIPYGLNGIIYQKIYSYLKELKIKVFNDINYDIFNFLKPRRYNVMVEKMVIALDNAIEAALSSNEKILVVNLYEENDSIVIEIKNTFSNQIDIDLLGTKGNSTKGQRRGLGLFSSFRDNEATLEVMIINDMFVSKITAKKRLEY